MRINPSAQTEVQGLSPQEVGVGPTSDLSQRDCFPNQKVHLKPISSGSHEHDPHLPPSHGLYSH